MFPLPVFPSLKRVTPFPTGRAPSHHCPTLISMESLWDNPSRSLPLPMAPLTRPLNPTACMFLPLPLQVPQDLHFQVPWLGAQHLVLSNDPRTAHHSIDLLP